MQQTLKCEKGSFLLELAITLLILGLIGAGVVQYAGHVTRAGDAVETRKRMEVVANALSNFVQINFRLPCPAEPNPGLVAAGTDFGTERANCNGAAAHGVVPYRTLGLPEFYANDGYGNYITYVVSPGFTLDNRVPPAGTNMLVHPRLTSRINAANVSLVPLAKFCAGSGDVNGDGNLTVQDITNDLDLEQGGTVLFSGARNNSAQSINPGTGLPEDADANYYRDPTQITNAVTAAAVVLVSHGENRWGAYTKDGGQFLTGNGGANEQDTAAQDNQIKLERNVSDVAGGANDRFDDVVRIFTQEQILALAGGGSCEEF